MLWAILLIFLILWMLGMVSGYTMDFVHIPLFIAIVALLFQIEDECHNYGSSFTKKRQFISRSGRILPSLALQSEGKGSKSIIPAPPYEKE